MPRMDGFKLLAEVKADERMKHLPVILLSARAGDEAAIEGLQAGAGNKLSCISFCLNFHPISHLTSYFCLCWLMFFFSDDYLVKPFGAKELVARVSTHLELSRFRRELEHLVQERTAKVKKKERREKSQSNNL